MDLWCTRPADIRADSAAAEAELETLLSLEEMERAALVPLAYTMPRDGPIPARVLVGRASMALGGAAEAITTSGESILSARGAAAVGVEIAPAFRTRAAEAEGVIRAAAPGCVL